MDSVSEALANGHWIKVLTIVDDFSKEAIDLAVHFGISGHYVTRVLDQAARLLGYLKAIRTEQGSEFTGKALYKWSCRLGVQLKLIQDGKPTQNAFIESFNGSFRDECRNNHRLTSLPQARILIAAWRRDYNQHRPHSALNYQTPAEFAAEHWANSSAQPAAVDCL